MSVQSPLTDSPRPSSPDERTRQVDSAAWAVFFIWVGVVMLADLPWAWFLVGVGVLVVGAQIVRQQRGLKIEMFGVIVGLIMLAAGIWDLVALPLPLMPIILIVLGGYLLWKTLSRRTESS
ncbi:MULTISPECIES: hypothetical protein [unclassified Bradyrhizobium]|uniref:hypothetical protein n=1 Tax=unclassified Bradyrhizobium TaxID=2631580 RepID=UPI0028E4D20A|nr:MULTISPECIES: hypothetical protein [unclassified Bradyrhizobium]